MNHIDTLTIHAASMCLDATANETFYSMTEKDIQDSFQDVLELILERQRGSFTCGNASDAKRLARSIIRLLIQCHRDRTLATPAYMLNELTLSHTNVDWR